uniref:Uncharacterized protein n=1 Tax=Rhizophora mucronata TaxID=61149 RepID=A0A2P2PA57_RHIMU
MWKLKIDRILWLKTQRFGTLIRKPIQTKKNER